PYLVLAAVLAGALYGLNNKLTPPEPMEGDAYADSDESTRLPYRWDDAIKALDKSAVIREYLGDEFVDVFCAIKRQEITELNSRISDIEYESYLGLL
ncbi:glutamine synthetase, partial [Gilvimarinus sp. 1_MG-2023]|nr:glutamine synthetase [Gilvimarinus sp. 1_MG-2023]